LGHLSSLNNGSPPAAKIKLGPGLSSSYNKASSTSKLERNESLKVKLSQIDKHLDINKLLAEVQLQANDSYTLRSLLKRLKEMANELLKAENVLHLKAVSLVQASVQARCTQCRQLVSDEVYEQINPFKLNEDLPVES
jgi:hypothetical protein